MNCKLDFKVNHVKRAVLDLQLLLYPWNRNLIKNVEGFISVNFSIASYKQEMRKSFSQRKRRWNYTV